VVDSLIALRGVDKLAAIVLLAELGDISRFDSELVKKSVSLQTSGNESVTDRMAGK
jgi:hypothetical protein